MRKWFGVALLGVVVFGVGSLGYAVLYAAEPRSSWPVAIARLVFLLAVAGGFVAALVGLIGASIAAIRSGRP
jgi:multisubunit Na+/H+ antiporter MnhB subunit